MEVNNSLFHRLNPVGKDLSESWLAGFEGVRMCEMFLEQL